VTVRATGGPARSWRRCHQASSTTVGDPRWRGALVVCLAVSLVAMAPARAAAAADAADLPVVAPVDLALVTVLHDTLVVRSRAVADGVFPAAPGVVTVVDLEEERGGADLGELLARTAGLQIRRYGGIGAEAVPSIRGSSGPQVQVLVDGLPLADAQRGAVDLSLLPLERYARAEIHRGLVPAGFGGIGAAGAVNLLTRPGAAGPEARLFAGSFGDAGGRLAWGVGDRSDSRRALLLIHGRRIDNDYEYLDHNQTFHNTADDTVRVRRNADFAEWGVSAHGDLEGDAGRVRAAAGWFRRDGGRPGPLGFPSPDARIRHERADARLGVTSTDDVLGVDLALLRREDHLLDPGRQVGADPYDRTVAVGEDALARVAWTPRWDAGEDVGLALTLGGDGRLQRYRETNDGEDAPGRHRRTVSAFAAVSVQLAGPRLSISPAWRWQRFRDDFPPVPPLPWLPEEEEVAHEQDAVSPSVGATWDAVPGRLVMEAHWHRTVRQPTWVELFGQPGGLVGDRELEPEEITGRDLGVRWTDEDRGAVLRVTGFDQSTEKTIIYYWAGLGMSRPGNIGRSRTRGVEVESLLQRGPVDLSVNVTWQHARDRGGVDDTYEGKALPYLSDVEAYADLRCQMGDWRPGLTVFHQSENYRTRYNRDVDRAPARTILGAALSRTWRGGPWGDGHEAVATLEVLNLTDNDVYDVEGYPLPGRTVRVALHWH
jgi:iron complex outermembrane receptor protein